MSRPTNNSFFETDFSKFMDMSKFADMSKMMGEFKMPGVNMDAMMSSHRRNMEALVAVNQSAFEALQSLARRQAEWMRQGFEEATNLVNATMSAETPEEKMIRHAEMSKAAVDKCMANAREIAETVNRTHCQAMEAVSNRLNEGIDELRDIVRTNGNGKVAA